MIEGSRVWEGAFLRTSGVHRRPHTCSSAQGRVAASHAICANRARSRGRWPGDPLNGASAPAYFEPRGRPRGRSVRRSAVKNAKNESAANPARAPVKSAPRFHTALRTRTRAAGSAARRGTKPSASMFSNVPLGRVKLLAMVTNPASLCVLLFTTPEAGASFVPRAHRDSAGAEP